MWDPVKKKRWVVSEERHPQLSSDLHTSHAYTHAYISTHSPELHIACTERLDFEKHDLKWYSLKWKGSPWPTPQNMLPIPFHPLPWCFSNRSEVKNPICEILKQWNWGSLPASDLGSMVGTWESAFLLAPLQKKDTDIYIAVPLTPLPQLELCGRRKGGHEGSRTESHQVRFQNSAPTGNFLLNLCL